MAERKKAEQATKSRGRTPSPNKGNEADIALAAGVAVLGALASSESVRKNPKSVIIAIICLIIGIVAGYFGMQTFTKDDAFALLGEDYLEVTMSDDLYADEGCKAMFLGEDLSQNVSVEYYYREDISYDAEKDEKVDLTKCGFYYVVYTCDAFPYSGIQVIRTVEVVRVEDNG